MRLCGIAAALLPLAAAPVRAAGPAAWWNPAWTCRSRVELLCPRLESPTDAASVVLETGGRARADGGDIRIVDGAGRTVPCRILAADARTVAVEFRVAGPDETVFHAYFGNSAAEKPACDWRPVPGGLRLETREKGNRRHPYTLAEMLQLVERSSRVFGAGPRGRIDDLENPFGPNANYVSVYRGTIVCPADGTYGFATNSDDASFLTVDGRLVAAAPGAHEQEGGSSRPLTNTWSHAGSIALRAGAHEIVYYQEDGWGSQCARAGWRPPGASSFSVIPAEAFAERLPARQAGFERAGAAVNPFFTVRTERTVRLIGTGLPDLVTVRFSDATAGAPPGVPRLWSFDGGAAAPGESVARTLAAGRPCVVRLRVGGAAFERVVRPEPSPSPEAVRLDAGIAPSAAFVPEGGTVRLSAWVRNYASAPAAVAVSIGGRTRTLAPAALSGATVVETVVARASLKECAVRFAYEGTVFAVRRAGFRGPRDDLSGLALRDGLPVDGRGDPVVFVGGGGRASGAARSGPVAFLGSLPAPADGGPTVMDVLAARLDERFGRGRVRTAAALLPDGAAAGSGTLAAVRMEELRRLSPRVVFFQPGLSEVLHGLPFDEVGPALSFAAAVFGSRGAAVVAVVPPPVPGRESRSAALAAEIKRAAARVGLDVVDFYSLLPRPGGAAAPLFRLGGGAYGLAPGPEARRAMGDRLFGKAADGYR